MSQANVEVVRRIYDAVARRDVLTPFELYDREIVWDMSRARTAPLLTTTIAHGHEGVREAWREGLAAFGQVDLDVEELLDAGDRVLAIVHEREVGRASGVPVEMIHYAVWTLGGGNVLRMQVFDDRDEAFDVAGLRADAVAGWRAVLIRRSFAAWNAQDPTAFAACWTSDCEFDTGPIAIGFEPTYRGHFGLSSLVATTASVFDAIAATILEMRQTGERVLVRARQEGHSRSLGIRPTMRFGQVVEFDRRLIHRVVQTDDPPPGWESAVPIE